MIKVNFCLPRSIRVKLNTSCQLNCKFCHQEGSKNSLDINNEELIRSLKILKKDLGFYRVHFTGGEPTLYNKFEKLLRETKKLGFLNALTTNGQFNSDKILSLKNAGLDAVNFSLHTLDPKTFLRIQDVSFDNKRNAEKWAKKCIENTVKNILLVKKIIKNTKINCVVSKNCKDPKDILDFCIKNDIKLRFLNDLSKGDLALNNIKKILLQKKAELFGQEITLLSSSYRLDYRIGDYNFGIKCIRPFFLESLCGKCNFKNTENCLEGFYGVRLEDNPLRVRLCLNKNSIPYVQSFFDFVKSDQYKELKAGFKSAMAYLKKDSLIDEQVQRYRKN